MSSTNQMEYFKRSAVFLKIKKVVKLTCSSIKVTFDWSIEFALNNISNGDLSVPLCDNVNIVLTLVRLNCQL